MKNLDLILDECLAQLASGASTLDQCLARHPEHVAELRPLLQTALGLTDLRNVQPLPTFKARARAQLTLHMGAHPRRKAASPLFLRFALSIAVFALACISAGTALAQSALPGDTLYNWKLTSEQTWRAVAVDSLAVDLTIAERRADEMLAVAGNADAYASAQEGYLDVLARLAVRTDAAALARIQPVLMLQQEMFAGAGISVPELDGVIQVNESIPPTPTVSPGPTLNPTQIPTLIPTLIPTPLPTFAPTPIPTTLPTVGVPTVGISTPPVPTLPITLP